MTTDIDIIFFLAWRNIVIRNEILLHIRLFNIHMGRNIDFTLEELSTYKYRGYLGAVNLSSGKEETLLLPNIIPYNVSCITFRSGINILKENSIPSTITTVKFDGNPIIKKFTKGILPDSITSLEFDYGSCFNQSFAGEWLPSSLKSLSLFLGFRKDIKVNQLPESLTELKIVSYIDYKGKIAPGSIPPIAAAKPLDYTFKWECEKELTNQESNVPISTTGYSFTQCIKEGDIPHNTVSIEFSELFNGEFQVPLPASLKSIHLGYPTGTSPHNIANVLQLSNLTSIDMGSYNIPLVSNLFPQSIISIKLNRYNHPIPEGYFYNYTNLKSLNFSRFDQVIPEKTLPPSLTSLDLGWDFEQIITEKTLPQSLISLTLGLNNSLHLNENILPPSLSTLKLGYYYDHPLNVNVLSSSLSTLIIQSKSYKLEIGQLPSSITSLSLGTKHPIPVGSLPCNLKVLYIKYPKFNQDLTLEGILPKSIQSIYFIRGIDKNYINNLDDYFFKEYIRFIK